MPVYPAGFPILIAAASYVLGPLAAHLAAPLMAGLLVLATYAVGRQLAWRWRSLLAFLVPAGIGPLLVIWSQAVLYGDPLTPGYPGWQALFSRTHITTNLELYPRLFAASHSYLPIVGLIALPMAWGKVATAEGRRFPKNSDPSP